MAEAKETTKDDKAPAKAKSRSGAEKQPGKLTGILIATVTAVVASLAGVGVTMLIRSGGPSSAEAGQPVPDVLDAPPEDDFDFSYHTFDRITVSLKSDRGHSYLIAVIVLKVKTNYMEAVQARLDEKKREVKDLMITYLGGLTVKDVLGSTNQNRIKRELRDKLNNLLWPKRRPGIYAVMFDEFQTD
ncbi:MAG: flagellar basal body-associated protein FliL [Phycisphaerae bacterium]